MTKNVWEKYTEIEEQELNVLTENYKKFLSKCKTERECVTNIVERIEKEGYRKSVERKE